MKTLLIAGGSASGKTWLAERLAEQMPDVTLLAQDSFYRDRPSGSAEDRHDFDFDQPYSIDWEEMEKAISTLKAGESADIPLYDFTVSLRAGSETVDPKGDILIVDGTLVLSQPDIVQLADAKLYVQCPEPLRRARRERRDVEDRGRSIESVRKQLAEQVFPAHDAHVRPSAREADLVLNAMDIVADPDAAVNQVLALLSETG